MAAGPESKARAGDLFLSAVGRTALTCYVLQNLLGSVIFYAWGFRLASYLNTWGVDGLAREGWVLGV